MGKDGNRSEKTVLRFYVISKGRIVKKPRIFCVCPTQIDILDVANNQFHRCLSYNMIQKIEASEKMDTEIIIKERKSKKVYYCEDRASLLSVLYEYYLPNKIQFWKKFIKWTKKGMAKRTKIQVGPTYYRRVSGDIDENENELITSRTFYFKDIARIVIVEPSIDEDDDEHVPSSTPSPTPAHDSGEESSVSNGVVNHDNNDDAIEYDTLAKMLSVVIYFKNGRRHVFFAYGLEIEYFITAIRRNMERYLRIMPRITEESGGEALKQHTMTRLGSSLQDILLSTSVKRVRRNRAPELVKLVFTSEGIYQIDISTSIILSFHNFANVHAIVRLGMGTSNAETEHQKQFIIEYENDLPYVYETPLQDEIITSIAEFCERRKFLPCIKFSRTSRNRHVGDMGFVSEDYDEVLLKRIATVKTTKPESWLPVLHDFNENFNLFKNTRPKEKKPVSIVLDILHHLIQIDIEKKGNMKRASRKSAEFATVPYSDFDIPHTMSRHMAVALQTLLRLMTIPVINESVASHAQDFAFLFHILQFNDPVVGYLAGSVIRACIDQMFDHKTEKKEHANKTALMRLQYDTDTIFPSRDSRRRESQTQREMKDVLFDVLWKRCGDDRYTLVSHAVLLVLESMMHSSVSSTERSLFKYLFVSAVKNIKLLFDISYRSVSRSLGMLSSIIVRVVLENCTEEKKRNIQDVALKKTLLIRSLHVCVNAPDLEQLACTGRIIGHLAETHKRNLAVLKRVIPSAFLKYMQSASAKAEEHHQGHRKLFSSAKKMDIIALDTSQQLRHTWTSLAIQLMKDHHNARLIWNEDTRLELKRLIDSEIASFEKSIAQAPKSDIVWNHFEFEITYKSTLSEPRIGGYYLNYLLENYETSGIGRNDEISDPEDFIEELHHTLLFSTDMPLRISCIRANRTVHVLYGRHLPPYPYMHHIIMLMKGATDNAFLRELLLLVGQLLAKEANANMFIQCDGIPNVMHRMTLALDFEKDKKEEDGDNEELSLSMSPSRGRETPIPVNIAEHSLSILLRLSTFHPSVDERGRVKVPTPLAKQILCTPQSLNDIVMMMTLQRFYPLLSVRVVALLNQLVMHNNHLLPDLYRTGVFFFVFLIDEVEFEEAALLLKESHAIQRIDLPDVFTSGRDDLSAPIHSILNGMLPREVIHRLIVDPHLKFGRAYQSDNVNTPNMIWNRDMRQHLRNQVQQHMTPFLEKIYLDRTAKFEYSPLTVEYSQLADEFVVHHRYMRNFVDVKTWPEDFQIEEPDDFLLALCNVVADRLSTSTTLKDEHEIAQCLQGQVLILKLGFEKTESVTSYPGLDSLVKCITVEAGTNLRDEPQLLLRFYLALELLNKIVQTGAMDADKILDTYAILRVVEVMRLCIDQVRIDNVRIPVERKAPTENAQLGNTESSISNDNNRWSVEEMTMSQLVNFDEKLMEIIQHCLKAMLILSVHCDATIEQLVDHENVMECLACLLRFPESESDILSQTFELLTLTAASFELKTRALQLGTILHLLWFMSRPKGTVSERNRLVATKVLRQMAGWCEYDENERACPESPIIQIALKNFIPDHLTILWQVGKDERFLCDFNEDRLGPSTLWNATVRENLHQFCEDNVRKMADAYPQRVFDQEAFLAFKYELHQEELHASGIFVRAFAADPKLQLRDPMTYTEDALKQLSDEHGELLREMESEDDVAIQFRMERLEMLLETICIAVSANKEPKTQALSFSEHFPAILKLLDPHPHFVNCAFYIMKVLSLFIMRSGIPVASALIKNRLIFRLRDMMYAQLRNLKETNDTLADESTSGKVFNNVCIVLHALSKHHSSGIEADFINSGMLLLVVAIFAGCFVAPNANSRKRMAFVLSEVLSFRDIEQCFSDKFAPGIIATVSKNNPIGAISFYEDNHRFPEFIWGEKYRKILTRTLATEVRVFGSQFGDYLQTETHWNLDFGVDYGFPREISGIYTSVLGEGGHESYPVEEADKVIGEMVEDLLNQNQQSWNLDFALETAHSLLSMLGGFLYHNADTVNVMRAHASSIVPFLSCAQDLELKRTIMAMLTKMSLSVQCIESFTDATELGTHLSDALKEIVEDKDDVLDVILRLVVRNKCFAPHRGVDGPLMDVLMKLLKSTEDNTIQNKCSHIMKALCERDSSIQSKLENEGLYDQFVSTATMPNEDVLFNNVVQPPPPMIQGGKLIYMNINLDQKELNKDMEMRLFAEMDRSVLVKPKTCTASTVSIAMSRSSSTGSSMTHHTPSKSHMRHHESLTSMLSPLSVATASQNDLTEQDVISPDDNVGEAASPIDKMQQESHSVETTESAVTSPVLPLAPSPTSDIPPPTTSLPPPPPPPPPSVPLLSSTTQKQEIGEKKTDGMPSAPIESRSSGFDLLSAIRAGVALKPASERQTVDAPPLKKTTSIADELASRLGNRRKDIDSDNDEDDYDDSSLDLSDED